LTYLRSTSGSQLALKCNEAHTINQFKNIKRKLLKYIKYVLNTNCKPEDDLR
jgi:hypothetical protein